MSKLYEVSLKLCWNHQPPQTRWMVQRYQTWPAFCWSQRAPNLAKELETPVARIHFAPSSPSFGAMTNPHTSGFQNQYMYIIYIYIIYIYISILMFNRKCGSSWTSSFNCKPWLLEESPKPGLSKMPKWNSIQCLVSRSLRWHQLSFFPKLLSLGSKLSESKKLMSQTQLKTSTLDTSRGITSNIFKRIQT